VGEPGIPRLGHRDAGRPGRKRRGRKRLGRLGRVARDVIGVLGGIPVQVVIDAGGPVQVGDLRGGQVPGRVVIVVPGEAGITQARGARGARGAVRGRAAAGRLVVPLAWFRRRSLPERSVAAVYVYDNIMP
jgi:hypothetical protein